MLLLARFRVLGHSMEPQLAFNSTVLASNIPYLFFQPKVGDVVVFKDPKKHIIKRIKKIEDGKYHIAGDNKNDSKEFGWIERKDILGKIIYKI